MQSMHIKIFGEKTYKLKHIAINEKIPISTLRKDVRNGILIPSIKIEGTYCIIQSQLDKYLDIINKRIKLSKIQLREMKHCIGLDSKNKLLKNGFYCKSNNKRWNDLISKDLANKSCENSKNYYCFSLNKRGIAYILGKSISKEKYENMLVCPEICLKMIIDKKQKEFTCFECFRLNNQFFK